MTISTTTSSVTLGGNGVTTSFPFAFVSGGATNISVVYTDASGNQTTLTPSQYTLTLTTPPVGGLWSIGGTVVYPISGSPIANGTSLTISRILSLTQLVSIQNQGPFDPQVVEQALDLLCMEIQQIENALAGTGGTVNTRLVQAPLVDTNPQMVLPAAATRANQMLGFDGSGNPLLSSPTNAVVSVAMQPVVSAATTAAARTAMGIITPSSGIVGGARNLKITVATTTTATLSWDEVNAETALNGNSAKSGQTTLSLNGATTGANGLDTGTLSVSTFYSLYAIYNGTTWACMACTAAVSNASIYAGANLPGGYTYSALIGVLLTDSSAHFVQSTQYDREVWYQTPINIFTGTTGPSANVLTTQSISAGVPAIAKTCAGLLGLSSSTASNQWSVAADVTGTGLQVNNPATTNPSTKFSFTMVGLTFRHLPILTAQTLFWCTGGSSNTNQRLSISGFTF